MSKALTVYGKKRSIVPVKRKMRKKRRIRRRMTQSEYIANAGLNIFSRTPTTPLPMKLKATFRLSHRCLLDIPIDPIDEATFVYSANGLFDPLITTGTAQPRGFDQLMALYDHYVVIGSKITAKMACMSTNANPVMFTISLRDQASATNQPYSTLEQSYCTWDIVAPSGESKSLVQTFNNQFLGRSFPLSDPDLKGSETANPAEQAYYHVTLSSPSGTNEPTNYVIVTIDYEAILIEPKRPVAS